MKSSVKEERCSDYTSNYITGFLSTRITVGIMEWRKHLLGKVLTTIEASIQDIEQRKAMKDLIHIVFGGGFPNYIGLRRLMASLSVFLREMSKEDKAALSSEEYDNYIKDMGFEDYRNDKLNIDLSKLKLG
ncbi:MAG: hypothetical protein ACFFDH_00140 [Promethearchaeota archaeon]